MGSDIGSNMKGKAYILICLFLLPLMGFVKQDVKMKKLTKLVEKNWKGEDIKMTKLELPDSLQSELGLLYSVQVDEILVGYACYATAFGCRIGGCAAPSENANVQSYETFDYIVLYDTNLDILLVDIVEYGGQYGYEICRASWLKQFQGKNRDFSLNENIDGITGATISAQYLIDDLNSVGGQLESIVNGSSDLPLETNVKY